MVFALLSAGLYANALDNPFHFDDLHSIEYNTNLRSLANIPHFFIDPGTFSSQRQGTMFRPLLLSSYAVNYALHGNWVPGYRVVNLLIHAGCAAMFFVLVIRYGGSRKMAWAMGLLFLIHPLHGEPINYISSRSDLLVSFFYLLALALVVSRPWGSGLAYAAALLTKSVAITLPVAVIVWDWLRQSSSRLGRRFVGTLLLLSGLYLAAIVANRFLTTSLAKAPRSFDLNLWTQLKALVYYLWLFCMPHKLSVEHPFAVARSLSDPAVLLSVLVLLSLGGLALVGRRRVEALAFAFFVLVLMPTTLMPLNILVSERRSYLASAGLVAIAVWSWGRFAQRRPRAGWAAAAATCVFMTMMVWARNPVWSSDISLWQDAVAKGPGMFRARANLGLAYAKKEHWQQAIEELEKALAIKGDYADAWVELGNIYHKLGRLELAERAYRLALECNPSLEGVYYNLGNLALGRGELELAIDFYRQTLERNPDFANAYNNLGQALEKEGDLGEALRQYQEAVVRDPELGGAWFNLGMAYENLGQREESLEAFRRAYELLVPESEFQDYAERAQQAILRLGSSSNEK